MKCPKCGSEDNSYTTAGYCYCHQCDCEWMVWQQTEIDRLQEKINDKDRSMDAISGMYEASKRENAKLQARVEELERQLAEAKGEK